MLNKGDREELTEDVLCLYHTLFRYTRGTFIEYIYGFECDGEFFEYDKPGCKVKFDGMRGPNIVGEYTIRKVQE